MSTYRRTFALVCFALVVVGATVLGCGKTIDSGEESAGADASPDASDEHVSAPDSGGCCPPAGPGCCMDYGGWTPAGRMCGDEECDGMPAPSDPHWKVEPDSHGCPHWTNPYDPFKGGTRSSTVKYCDPFGPPPPPSDDAGDMSDANDAAADGRD